MRIRERRLIEKIRYLLIHHDADSIIITNCIDPLIFLICCQQLVKKYPYTVLVIMKGAIMS